MSDRTPLDAALAGPACATEREFGELATGTLATDRRLVLEQHATSCARCAAEFALASAFSTAADTAGSEDVEAVLARLAVPAAAIPRPLPFTLRHRRTSAPTIATWSSPLRLAASVAVLVGAGLLVARLGLNQPSLPDPNALAALRNATIEVVEPTGTLTAVPMRLVWSSTPGATHYRVELTTNSGEQLVARTVDQPSLELDQPVRDRLATGVACSWSVVALDANGAILAQSARVNLRVQLPR